MLGAAQDQLAPIRLSGHTLDKATKAKVDVITFSLAIFVASTLTVCLLGDLGKLLQQSDSTEC